VTAASATVATGEQIEDAVRLVEDAIDASSQHAFQVAHTTRWRVPTDRTGQAVVDAMLEAGWTPPRAAGAAPPRHGRTLGTGR
jgi:hypothetical protein